MMESWEEVDDLFYGEMSLCGCMEMGDLYGFLHQWFRHLNSRYHVRGEPDVEPDFAAAQKHARLDECEPLYYLAAALLEGAGILEHGSSIRCPWLTAKGKVLLAWMDANPDYTDPQERGMEEDGR